MWSVLQGLLCEACNTHFIQSFYRAGHDYGCANTIGGSGTISILVVQVLLALMNAYDVCAPIGW